MEKKAIVIDGNNLACVAYFANMNMIDQGGLNVALDAFKARVKHYEDILNPTDTFICWDTVGGTAWRKEVYPDYKANRKNKNPDLLQAINLCRDNNGFENNIAVEESEGDDVIYVLCKLLSELDYKNTIMSTDKDMIQIVQEGYAENIFNLTTGDESNPYREIPNYDIVIEKSICGDSSDFIHGVPKKGIKFFEKYTKGEATLKPDEIKEMKRCESIVRISLNPNLSRFEDTIRLYLDSKGYTFKVM